MTLLPRVIGGLIQGPPKSPIELHSTNPYPTPTPTHTSLLYVILCSTCMIVPWYRPVTPFVKLPSSLLLSMQVAGTEGGQTSNALWTLPRFILPARWTVQLFSGCEEGNPIPSTSRQALLSLEERVVADTQASSAAQTTLPRGSGS